MDAVKEESRIPDHYTFGMFAIALMSYGGEGDVIQGSDGILISLPEIRDLLSSCKFPAMAGKPKLMVVQTCSGGMW